MRATTAHLPSSSWSFFFCRSSISRHVLVGDLLHLVQRPPLVVFRNLVVLEQLLQAVVGVAADLAHGVAAVFGVLVDQPRHLLAAFLGQRRNRDAQDLAVGRGIQAEVGFLDAVLDAPSAATDRTAARRSALARGPTATPPGSAARSRRRPRRAPDRAATTVARPLRRPASSLRTCSIAASIRFLTSALRLFRSLTSMASFDLAVIPWASARPYATLDRRADRFAHDDAPQVAGAHAA